MTTPPFRDKDPEQDFPAWLACRALSPDDAGRLLVAYNEIRRRLDEGGITKAGFRAADWFLRVLAEAYEDGSADDFLDVVKRLLRSKLQRQGQEATS